jgi:hypothetical protein
MIAAVMLIGVRLLVRRVQYLSHLRQLVIKITQLGTRKTLPVHSDPLPCLPPQSGSVFSRRNGTRSTFSFRYRLFFIPLTNDMSATRNPGTDRQDTQSTVGRARAPNGSACEKCRKKKIKVSTRSLGDTREVTDNACSVRGRSLLAQDVPDYDRNAHTMMRQSPVILGILISPVSTY